MKWLILASLTIAVFSLGFYTGSTTVNPSDNRSEVATEAVPTESINPTTLVAKDHSSDPFDAPPAATINVNEVLAEAEPKDSQNIDLPKNSDVLIEVDSTDHTQAAMVNSDKLSGEMSDEELMEMDDNLILHLAMEGKVLSDGVIKDTGELIEDVLPAELLELESQTPILFGKEATLDINDGDFDIPLIEEEDNINE